MEKQPNEKIKDFILNPIEYKDFCIFIVPTFKEPNQRRFTTVRAVKTLPSAWEVTRIDGSIEHFQNTNFKINWGIGGDQVKELPREMTIEITFPMFGRDEEVIELMKQEIDHWLEKKKLSENKYVNTVVKFEEINQ
jgi:hypothetical protein